MKAFFIFIIALSCALLMAVETASARIQNTGDMIIDDGWVSYNRPWVPSDNDAGPDWFNPAVTFTYNPNADMFDGMRRPRFDFGREDMLQVHPRRIPHYPLFDR